MAMAAMAIGVVGLGNVCIDTSTGIGVGRAGVKRPGRVLMLVVPQVRGLHRSFMLAIRRRCGPQGLQRQPHQQKDGDPATHDFSIASQGFDDTPRI